MFERIQELGAFSIERCMRIGDSGVFLLKVLTSKPRMKQGFHMLLKQLYMVGVLSLSIIVVSALFIGMVIALQGYNTLQKFGVQQQLGQLLALSIVRELGPVVTALLFAGRAGSALAAEIGLMRATQQIVSMEMMAVDPMRRVIAPRYWAGVISMPILAMIFCVIAIYGGSFVGVNWLGIDPNTFWSNMRDAVHFRVDVVNGLIKSVVFGFVVTWIAVYQGFYTAPTASGIGKATTRAVVYSSLAILGLDFILTAMMLRGW